MTLAVARSLTQGNDWREHLTRVELPALALYELGGGGAIRRACRSWSKGVAPWEAKGAKDRLGYFAAGANGAAMRVLPHAILGAEDRSFDRVAERIVLDGMTTHGHPRALLGALAAGYGMWSALRWSGKVSYGELIEDCLYEVQAWSRLPDVTVDPGWLDGAREALGVPFSDAWDRTTEEMTGLLAVCRDAMRRGSVARDRDVLEELGAFGKESGSGIRSAAIAIYLASRYVAKPSAGLLAAAFAKRADTDTIACMAGAILGAFAGDTRVDGLAGGLLDSSYISDLAVAVAGHEKVPLRAEAWEARTSQSIRRRLGGLERGSSVTLPLFGESFVADIERPETKSANEISIWWLKTELGQTLAITKVAKGKNNPSTKGRSTSATSRPDQLAIGEMAREDAAAAQSTWTFVFVRDLARALGLYNEILGLPVRRQSATMAVLGGSLVLEQSELQERRAPAKSFEALEVIGVLATPKALEAMHRRATKAGYAVSDITRGRHGDRFRVRDHDGHVIEVWASPPGEATTRST